MKNYQPDIRAQYERYPFPLRRPEDEARRLIVSELDHLSRIDHHGFGGRRDFDEPFRILVAGGGTGDALVFLAEQLRGKPAEFVFLDMSAASIEVARGRAAVRGIEGVRWMHDSILNLAELGLGTFDYINCVGVLHHLEDPSAGLAQLAAALAPGGAMGLMLYAKYGRSDVYQVQELLELLHGEEPELARRVDAARGTLSHLMRSGLLRAGPGALELIEDPASDSYLVDTYLHGQDRAFSVSDIHELLAGCELELSAFTNFFDEQGATCALEYDPQLFLGGAPFAHALSTLPAPKAAHVAELLGQSTSMHAFYATREAQKSAAVDDQELTPYFATGYGRDALRGILEGNLRRVDLRLNCGITRSLDLSEVSRFVLECVGEGASTRSICAEAARRVPGADATRVTHEVFGTLDLMVRLGLVALRSADLPALPIQPSARPWNGAIDLRPFAALTDGS